MRAAWRNVPVVLVPAAGVLSERGEVEGASAATGILWSGGRTTPLVVPEVAPASALAEALGAAASDRATTALLFPRADLAPDALEGLSSLSRDGSRGLCVFGAGTVGGSAVALDAAGRTLRGRVVGLALHGVQAPLVEFTPACRLLTPFTRVVETSSGMVLTLGDDSGAADVAVDDIPALDLLSTCMPELRGAAAGAAGQPQPVVFVALADPDPAPIPGAASPERYVVRPVRGIDPARRGVMVGPEVKPGMRLAFAVRDAAAARSGLESTARSVSQQAMGAAPRFALYLSCAGRGQGLYGSPDVESRMLRQRFGDLPIAGMHGAFELVPWAPGETRLALYTGVLALFRSPS